MADPITILIVDDSRLFRSALKESLTGQKDIVVVGSVFNGAKALEFISKTPPDLVTLDVEMPGMDGLATLEQIQQLNAQRPASAGVDVIMVSAFTRRGADVTVKALEAGAFDFVTKPSGPSQETNIAVLRDELIAKIRACGRRKKRTASSTGGFVQPAASVGVISRAHQLPSMVRAVVIGASTGGPRALSIMLPELCRLVDIPILIVQHMPPDFTRSLAESLGRQTGRTVVEAADGMLLQKNMVFVAPGGRHLLLRGSANSPIIGVTEQPPENGCRPSADVLFRSAAAVLRSGVVAVILTGMGCDGTAGLGAVHRAGGYVIAQDETSSVVWGMPGSVVQAGLADEVLPLDRIARSAAAVVSRTVSGE
jgi:two-component system chemotaxis response regulator CheB